MARKKESEITYPGRAHPTFTVEETKERERQQQRDKRARRKQEKSVAGPSTLGGQAGPSAHGQSMSEDITTPTP